MCKINGCILSCAQYLLSSTPSLLSYMPYESIISTCLFIVGFYQQWFGNCYHLSTTFVVKRNQYSYYILDWSIRSRRICISGVKLLSRLMEIVRVLFAISVLQIVLLQFIQMDRLWCILSALKNHSKLRLSEEQTLWNVDNMTMIQVHPWTWTLINQHWGNCALVWWMTEQLTFADFFFSNKQERCVSFLY